VCPRSHALVPGWVILIARVGVRIENVCTAKNVTRMRLRLEELSVVAFSTAFPVLLCSVRRIGTMAYSAPTAQQYAAVAGVSAPTRLRRSALLGALLPSVAYIRPTVRARTLCPDRAPAAPTRLDVFSGFHPGRASSSAGDARGVGDPRCALRRWLPSVAYSPSVLPPGPRFAHAHGAGTSAAP
jgi:hypothetical protein